MRVIRYGEKRSDFQIMEGGKTKKKENKRVPIVSKSYLAQGKFRFGGSQICLKGMTHSPGERGWSCFCLLFRLPIWKQIES